MERHHNDAAGLEPPESSLWGVPLWVPPADVLRTQDEVIVRVELAGAAPGDLRLRATDRELSLTGSRREPSGPRPVRIDRMEIAFGPFERTIPLPAPVHPESATARLADGLLEVVLPLADPPTPAPRRDVVVAIVLRES